MPAPWTENDDSVHVISPPPPPSSSHDHYSKPPPSAETRQVNLPQNEYRQQQQQVILQLVDHDPAKRPSCNDLLDANIMPSEMGEEGLFFNFFCFEFFD